MIAGQHLEIGHQVMSKRHRLRGLEVGEAGHDRGGMFVCAHHQRFAQSVQPRKRAVGRIAHPKAEIGCDLIVAAARSVEASGGCADQFGQPRLDRHVNVFEVPVFGDAIGFVFARNLVEPAENRGAILLADDPVCAEHLCMCLRGADVLPPQGLVERDRGVDFAHDRARSFGEPAAPHGILGVAHVAFDCFRFSSGAVLGGLR